MASLMLIASADSPMLSAVASPSLFVAAVMVVSPPTRITLLSTAMFRIAVASLPTMATASSWVEVASTVELLLLVALTVA